jgi:hypothetical protein
MKKGSDKLFAGGIRISLIILFIIGIVFVLAACTQVAPTINIILGDDDGLYAGAVVTLSAEIFSLAVEGDIVFEIQQEEDIASIDNEGNLIIASDASTGATFEILVTVSGYTAKKAFTIGMTPVSSITLSDIAPLYAGDDCVLNAIINPVRAREHGISYEIISGSGVAAITDGVLTLSDSAKFSDDIRIVAVAGGVRSEEVSIEVLTVPAVSIEIDDLTIYAGEEFELKSSVLPENTTDTIIEYTLVSGNTYAEIDNGKLVVDISAPVGANISVSAAVGDVVSIAKEYTVAEKAVEEVMLRAKYYENYEVKLLDTRELEVEIAPFNATEKDYNIIIVSGEGFIDYDAETRTFTVTAGAVGDEIVFKAVSDGVESDELIFDIVKTPVESVILEINGESVAAAPGDDRRIIASVEPQSATYSDIQIEIDCASEDYYEYEDGVLYFYDAPDGTQIILTAYADGVFSEPLVFTIASVPVTDITISTEDPITELKSGDTVVFDAVVTPQNATQKQLTYTIVSGNTFGSITPEGVFTVAAGAVRGEVTVMATSADGVDSNIVTIEIYGTYYKYAPSGWEEIDNSPNKFNGEINNALWLDLKALPLDADGTTVIISSEVRNLVIEGGYSGTAASCIHNLKFYFLSEQSTYVTLINLGIKASERFGGTVIDFGTESEIMLEIAGDSYIEAGSPYAPYASGFTVDGAWSDASTNYIRKHGMDGYGGYDGGTALSAKTLKITGEANLTVKAGNGSSGTAGGRGADTPYGVVGETAGNGGRGGYGGNSGYAIFADRLIVEMTGTIYAYGGDAGTGGTGGDGGVGSSVLYNGQAGAPGASGNAYAPLYAYASYQLISGTVNSIYLGDVVQNTETRSDNYADFAEKLEKIYKVDIHYGTDFWNPYAPSLFFWKNKYRMTQQNNTAQILKLLYGLEGAFTMFPENSFIELSIVNTSVDIYLVNTITNSSGGTVYGLTSNVNNMWFATFDTKLRDTFYSTYYNIMVHEILHMFTFSMGSTSSNPMKTGLPAYNLGQSYNSGSSSGVYNPSYGYGANNSAFLTQYSKTDFNEDISDNMSLIAMLVHKADYLESGKPIYLKAKYIANTYRNFYKSYAYFMPASWERFIFE